MDQKIVVITGANSGIGKAATMKFAEEGHRVIMACRNMEKSEEIKRQIMTQVNTKNLDLIELDLASFDSIKRFCLEFKRRYDRLDVLIHNAARFDHSSQSYALSPDHIELTFATNTVGPYLMTQMLKDRLAQSSDGRVLHACSTIIRRFFEPKRKIDDHNLQGENKDIGRYHAYNMYGNSKMALLLLTFKMAEAYKESGIMVNAIQIPAIKLSKERIKSFKYIWRIAAMIQSLFSDSPESMADTYYHICTSDSFKFVSGKLFNEKREIMQPSHYKSGLIQEIKQFKDKRVYPMYADQREHIDAIWNICNKLTESTSKTAEIN